MCPTNGIPAAENFVDAYYTALQSSRHTISSYYCPHEVQTDGKVVPVIIWNGNLLPDVASFQKMFENDMPYTHYDVQSLDCHVLNPTSLAADKVQGGNGAEDKDIERRMSIVVAVSGSCGTGPRCSQCNMRLGSRPARPRLA